MGLSMDHSGWRVHRHDATIWPMGDLWPSNALRFGQEFFRSNLMVTVISKQFDLWLTQVDPCMTFDPTLHYSSVRGSCKFGTHMAFLRQNDLWMTFDLWWGHFEKLLLNLMGPHPTTLPSFGSMRWSTAKCIHVSGQTKFFFKKFFY